MRKAIFCFLFIFQIVQGVYPTRMAREFHYTIPKSEVLDKCRKLEIKSVNQDNEPVDIAHDPPLPINVDGEPCMQTPASIEFYPKQLWIRGAQEVSWDKV